MAPKTRSRSNTTTSLTSVTIPSKASDVHNMYMQTFLAGPPATEANAMKRGPGRPRKHPLTPPEPQPPHVVEETAEDAVAVEETVDSGGDGGRGDDSGGDGGGREGGRGEGGGGDGGGHAGGEQLR